MIEQAEGVERVADDLGDSPGCDKQQHAVLTLHLQNHTEGKGGRTNEAGSHVTLLKLKLDLNTEPCCFRCSKISLHYRQMVKY